MRSVTTLFFFLLLNVSAFAQTRTPNIGFEDGTFNNWQCYSGSVGPSNSEINVNPTSPISGLFTVYGKESAQEMDPIGKFPVLCPNGSNYSVKINDRSHNKKAERITYTFQAPSSGPYSIIFNYAVVLEDNGHPRSQQPQFTAFVYDVTDGIYIDCPSFDFQANPSIPGFKTGSDPQDKGTPVDYKPWSTATIDLRGYLGKTIRLEFTVNDCTLGGHYGYAYLDVEDSDSISPITGNAYCLGQTSVNLVGPSGFAQYNWYTSDLKTPITGASQSDNGQRIVISPPPPDQTSYALVIHPFDGLGCTDTLYTTVNKINAGFIFKAPDTIYACIGKTFDLTSRAVVAGSDADLEYSYYTDSIGTVYAYNPNLLTESGQYYIKAINKEGCTGIKPVYVAFELPSITIVNPAPVKYPQSVDITQAFARKKSQTYAYFTDTTSNIQVKDPTAIPLSGTYYLRVLDINGCMKWYPIMVIVNPPDPFVLSAPTAFTPNGDGINDLFQFFTKGYIDFGNVKIFNRNGQQVFLMKNLNQSWDGTYGGKQVPDGVYYWVFEGTDTYYNVNVTKSGSVTIVR